MQTAKHLKRNLLSLLPLSALLISLFALQILSASYISVIGSAGSAPVPAETSAFSSPPKGSTAVLSLPLLGPTRSFKELWSPDHKYDAPFPISLSDMTAAPITAQQDTPYRYFIFLIGAQAPVGQFHTPTYLAVAPDGSIYVVDKENCRVQRFNATGLFINAWGSCGSEEGKFFASHRHCSRF